MAIAVRAIKGWAFTDSLVEVDSERLCKCLAADALTNTRGMLTEAECEAFVCGSEDEDPSLAGLKKQFPSTDAYLNELWGT